MNWIPFLDRFRVPITSGTKQYTLRSRKYGNAGDLLSCPFGKIRLLEVRQEKVGYVAEHLYKEEGCGSPEEFIETWKELHPGGYFPENVKWLHHFEFISPAPEPVATRSEDGN